MEKIFDEVATLDKRCYEQYGLSEDILMEHAANSMLDFIKHNFNTTSKILIACGMGNNGADGITLARLLYDKYDITLFIPFELKSNMALLQFTRAKKIGIISVNNIDYINNRYDLVVDCLFGSGLNRDLNNLSVDIIQKLNFLDGYKLSCDIPSGINNLGQIKSIAFKANKTITMGALKKSLFSDIAKDYIGELIVANLGVQRDIY